MLVLLSDDVEEGRGGGAGGVEDALGTPRPAAPAGPIGGALKQEKCIFYQYTATIRGFESSIGLRH